MFLPTFASECQPGERDAGVVLLDVQFQDPSYSDIVQGGNDFYHLTGIGPVSEHRVHQPGHILTEADQGAEMTGSANGPGKVDQIDPLKREQITLGYHANQSVLVIHHANVSKVMLCHQHGGFKSICVGCEAAGVPGHDLADRRVQRALLLCHHGAQVPEGEYTRRMPFVIGDHDAPDTVFVHARNRFSDREVRRADDGVANSVTFQRGVQRVTGTNGSHGAGLYALIHLIKQAADAAKAEITKGITLREQHDKGVVFNAQTEGVSGGAMQCAGGAFSNQRGQWKTFALADFKGGFGFSVPVSLPFAANTALFDHVEPLHRAVVR